MSNAAVFSFYPQGVIPSGDVIWVFGSQLGATHAKGDARIAVNHFAAKPGVVSGPTGRSYAIATRNQRSQPLPIADIAWEVSAFVSYARKHSEQSFVVSRVGNGMAGLHDGRIAPMFRDAPENCHFCETWRPYLCTTPALAKA